MNWKRAKSLKNLPLPFDLYITNKINKLFFINILENGPHQQNNVKSNIRKWQRRKQNVGENVSNR